MDKAAACVGKGGVQKCAKNAKLDQTNEHTVSANELARVL